MSRSRWLPALALAALAGALFALERARPLRRRVDPGPRRIGRNLAMAAVTGAVIRVAERPLVARMARRVQARRWGLLPRLALPCWAERAAAVVLLDYTLYLWHILLHRVPALWRFHLAHHVDLDLDTTTAVRFHFGEFLASVPWRLAQVGLIGVTPRSLALWQKLALAEIVFHHANLRLPPRWEGAVEKVLMSPRLHGIHHSRDAAERDTNYSSGLTVWDRLHGTLRTGVPQREVSVGVPPWDRVSQVTLGKSLALPFEKKALDPPATMGARTVQPAAERR